MSAGFKTPLPFMGFSMGGGVLTPITPSGTSVINSRSLVSGLNIRSEIQRIRGQAQVPGSSTGMGGSNKNQSLSGPVPLNQTLANALSSIQDHSNTVDQLFRNLQVNLNSTGLTKDPAGNIVFQGATFTVRAGSQVMTLQNGRLAYGVANTPPNDGDILPQHLTAYLDEVGNRLVFRVRYSDGTLKTGSIALV